MERLRARRVEIEAAIFARVRGEGFEHAGADDAEYVAGLRVAVTAAVGYGLQGMEWNPTHPREWAGPVPETVVEQARRAARAGVSLDTVLRRYVVGHTLLGEYVLEEAEREERAGVSPARRRALREAVRAQASLLNRLLATVTAEYEQELTRVRRSPERRRLEAVRRLLAGGGEGGEGVEGGVEGGMEGDVEGGVEGGVENGTARWAGAGLGYALEGWHVGIVAVGAGAARAVRELAARADLRSLSVAPDERSVWAWLGAGERSAFGGVGSQLADVAATEGAGAGERAGVTIALGEPGRGLAGWRLTHRQAQAALVVAQRRPRPFTHYAEVALLASALTDELLAGTLIDVYIAPLQDARGGGKVLCETLRAYFAAERGASSAAAALRVTRKTVEGRLRTIEQRLGRTLHPAPAELEIALALDGLGGGVGSE